MYSLRKCSFIKTVLLFFIGVVPVISINAAKPVELIYENITYRILGSEASVVSAERNLGYVHILDYIEYDNKTYPVTRIEVQAFYDNLMTSVYIPRTIKSSGEMAFSARIKDVYIEDLEAWCGITFES